MSQAIDRWVWYAGWSDKFAQVLGGLNPVAGPYFDISAPEPTGVVAVLAPQASSLLGLVSVLAPVIVSGQHRRGPDQRAAPAAGHHALRGARDLRRARAAWSTSSPAAPPRWRPGSPRTATSTPSTSTGAAGADGVEWGDLELAAAENLKRVLRPAGTGADAVEPDWSRTPDLRRLTRVPRDQDRLAPQGPLTLGARPRPVVAQATARVVVLAGPSGAGKSRLAARLSGAHGWPIVRLDDFYRDEDDPPMPRSAELGIIDWDHPDSWNRAAARRGAVAARRRRAGSRPPSTTSPRSRAVDTAVLRARPARPDPGRGHLRGRDHRRPARARAARRRVLRAPPPLGHLRPAAAARPVRAAQAAADAGAPRAGADARRAAGWSAGRRRWAPSRPGRRTSRDGSAPWRPPPPPTALCRTPGPGRTPARFGAVAVPARSALIGFPQSAQAAG